MADKKQILLVSCPYQNFVICADDVACVTPAVLVPLEKHGKQSSYQLITAEPSAQLKLLRPKICAIDAIDYPYHSFNLLYSEKPFLAVEGRLNVHKNKQDPCRLSFGGNDSQLDQRGYITVTLRVASYEPTSISVYKNERSELAKTLISARELLAWLEPKLDEQEIQREILTGLLPNMAEESELEENQLSAIQKKLAVALEEPDAEFNLELKLVRLASGIEEGQAGSPDTSIIYDGKETDVLISRAMMNDGSSRQTSENPRHRQTGEAGAGHSGASGQNITPNNERSNRGEQERKREKARQTAAAMNKNPKVLKIIFVGLTSSGKSSLANALLGYNHFPVSSDRVGILEDDFIIKDKFLVRALPGYGESTDAQKGEKVLPHKLVEQYGVPDDAIVVMTVGNPPVSVNNLLNEYFLNTLPKGVRLLVFRTSWDERELSIRKNKDDQFLPAADLDKKVRREKAKLTTSFNEGISILKNKYQLLDIKSRFSETKFHTPEREGEIKELIQFMLKDYETRNWQAFEEFQKGLNCVDIMERITPVGRTDDEYKEEIFKVVKRYYPKASNHGLNTALNKENLDGRDFETITESIRRESAAAYSGFSGYVALAETTQKGKMSLVKAAVGMGVGVAALAVGAGAVYCAVAAVAGTGTAQTVAKSCAWYAAKWIGKTVTSDKKVILDAIKKYIVIDECCGGGCRF